MKKSLRQIRDDIVENSERERAKAVEIALDDQKCSDHGGRCAKPATPEMHSCPYQADVNDPADRCRCCDACQHECAQDI